MVICCCWIGRKKTWFNPKGMSNHHLSYALLCMERKSEVSIFLLKTANNNSTVITKAKKSQSFKHNHGFKNQILHIVLIKRNGICFINLVIDMTIFHSFLLNLFNRKACLQYRQYATSYTKTLNMPVTKFPAYVKKTQRPRHDGLIREV